MQAIDYEKISLAAREEASNLLVSVRQVKKIIEAYEAQKNPPEWVPLDLATVKQGQEVRQETWVASISVHRFVALFEGSMIVEADRRLTRYPEYSCHVWLMRAPKPKTVHVRVYKKPNGMYGATAKDYVNGISVVGEGDIKVRE